MDPSGVTRRVAVHGPVGALRGLWRRSMIRHVDGSVDRSTQVRWLQGWRSYADLRQPAPARGFAGVRGLADLSIEDCAWLARQEAFAGRLVCQEGWFLWRRWIDYQPPAAHPDSGSLHWEEHVLVERGRELDYLEHWYREALPATQPTAAVWLRDAAGRTAVVVRVGAAFMYARERPGRAGAGEHLSGHVARARTLQAAQALVDCEVSFGQVARGFHIDASTLPYRVGDALEPQAHAGHLLLADRAARGERIARQWRIVGVETDPECASLPLAEGLLG